MSLRLRVQVDATASPETTWAEMVDWPGQGRWIPFTSVRAVGDRQQGVGVRVVALSGFWLGRIPLGLLDRFVVTGWSPPSVGGAGELEVLHLGPYFTGEGAFRVEPTAAGTRIVATEVFSLPGGAPVEAVVRLLLPLMAAGFRSSLRALKKVAEAASSGGST